jgi:hypothetical protein
VAVHSSSILAERQAIKACLTGTSRNGKAQAVITGSCLCNQVAWRLDAEIELINHCHCSMCRKAHGSAFGSFAHAQAAGFRWTRGEASISRYESSPEVFRCFCRVCGSSVPAIEGDEVTIAAGGIDGDPLVRPSVHIFVGSKAAWYDITDALPQYERFPPDWSE